MVNKQAFRNALLRWYTANKRDLPWRETKDAYRIWVSEVILQQTRVDQGMAYYYKFIDAFPTIKDLAKAKEDKVLKLWQGLGYYSRARNMHAAAKTIVDQYKGQFPESYEKILSLKGVGEYTAAAIASFAYNEPKPVIDGNVYRFLGRLFGIQTPIDSTQGKREFKELANELMHVKEPATYNQAIMEFGSQYCKPRDPDCEQCVFKQDCEAYRSGMVSVIPVKSKRIKVRNRFLNYVVLIDKQGKVLLHKRDQKDIWKGLYEFELHESGEEADPALFLKTYLKQRKKEHVEVLHVSETYKHLLSHQQLYARFFVVRSSSAHPSKGVVVPVRSLTKFAFPRLIEKFMDDCNLNDLT